MTGDATKRNHGCFTILLLRMAIAISALVIYLRGLPKPERESA